MPPKASAAKEKLAEQDEVLQAVILADSFNTRFKPLTTSKPRCLLPICNAPLLDWTLESLALAGVQEVFVICRSHAEQVKAALQKSRWSAPSSSMKIVPILTAKETFSPGDALRDIYTHGIITSDFVLVSGDLVSSVRIEDAVTVHRERRKKNKDVIMTMVVKESGARHRTKSRGDSAVYVIDPTTDECLHYEPVTGFPPKQVARIPREVLDGHPDVEIRYDLLDCSIDICSVEVPSLFQDNFDYADIRRDFVHGVLTSDLLMKNIHCYVAREGYAARVQDTRSYDAVSKDILARWTFPLVPDDYHPAGQSYELLRGNRYIPRDNSVVLARTCKVGNNTLLGPSSRIGDGAQVLSSTLGARCIIGVNSVVRHAYLFDGVVVGDDCVIEHAIVGAGVSIGSGSRVGRGALVGDGVELGPGSRLAPFERVSLVRDEADEEWDSDSEYDEAELGESRRLGDDSTEDSLKGVLGPNSNAFVWPRRKASAGVDEGEEDAVEGFQNQRLMRIGDEHEDLDLSDAGSTTDSEDEELSDTDSDLIPASLASSTTTMQTESAASAAVSAGEAAAEHEFLSEVRQSLSRAFVEDHSVDNAAVELKTLRMAHNQALSKVREAVVGGIVERIPLVADPARQRAEIQGWVGRWGALINLIGGVDGYHCAQSERFPLFGPILAALYQDDVVEEDDIRAWHAQPAAKGEGMYEGKHRDKVQKCWLVGARMIHQFDEQESDEETEDENSD
ncbi:nucleotide-diphospho-sugar transferase [Vararia minispora EC-137]|uniref:Nucleotide-diphospho-sugar transferase n=1 Tax=Vararia minispora EC-137 TaxID=1314806 RepID=A0ACB8QVX5_9AGAM|nr:nucleotide-diphospho-sugar transferase [Vararia minispora EC-137]